MRGGENMWVLRNDQRTLYVSKSNMTTPPLGGWLPLGTLPPLISVTSPQVHFFTTLSSTTLSLTLSYTLLHSLTLSLHSLAHSLTICHTLSHSLTPYTLSLQVEVYHSESHVPIVIQWVSANVAYYPSRSHTYASTNTYAYIHPHAQLHLRTYTYTHAYTYTAIHTHIHVHIVCAWTCID